MRKFLRLILRILLFAFLFFIILVPLILLILFSFSSVQTYAIEKVNSTLTNKIQSTFRIKQVSIQFPYTVKLKEVYIEDKNGDTLIYSKVLITAISFRDLLSKKIVLSDVIIINGKVNFHRESVKDDFNFTFIGDAFSDTTQKGSSWEFDVNSIELKSIDFRYKDIPGGVSFSSFAKSLKVDINSLGIEKQYSRIGKVNADSMYISLNFYNPEKIKANDIQANNSWRVELEKLQLTNSSIVFNNFTQKALTEGIDFNRLNITSVNTSINNIEIGDTIAFELNKFSGKDISGFTLNELKGDIRMSPNKLQIDKLVFNTPDSRIENPIYLSMPIEKNVDVFSLSAKARWDKESIAFKDLNYFIPGIDTVSIFKDKKLTISGDVSGELNDILLNNLKLSLDKNNFVNGDFLARGLPDVSNTYLDFTIKNVKLDSATLAYLNQFSDTLVNLKALKGIALHGSIKGKVSNSTIGLNLETGNGNLSTVGKLKIGTNFDFENFTGDITTSNFNLGEIFPGLEQFGKISLKTSINTDAKEVESINASVSELEFNNYIYQDIKIRGSKKNDVLDLDGIINDTKLQSSFSLKADLKHKYYKAEGDLSKVNLHTFGIKDSSLTLNTKFKLDVKGNSLDSMEGIARLNDIVMSNSKDTLLIDSFIINSTIEDQNHELTIAAPSLQAHVNGNYKLSELSQIYEYLLTKYSGVVDDSNYAELKTESIDFKIKAGNISKPLSFLLPEIEFVDSINGEGAFNKLNDSLHLSITAVDSKLFNTRVQKAFIEANTSSDKLEFKFGAEQVQPGSNIQFDNPQVKGAISNDSTWFNVKLHDQNSETRASIDGVLRKKQSVRYVHFPSADIVIKGVEWQLHPDNEIVLGRDSLMVQELELMAGNQKIAINSDNQNSIKTIFYNVQLDGMADIAGLDYYKMEGVLNGELFVGNIFNKVAFKTQLKVDSFSLSNQELGQLVFNAAQDSSNEFLKMDMNVSGRTSNATMSGRYPLDEKNEMDFDVVLTNLNLKAFESFTKDFAHHLRGKMTGELRVKGKTDSPQVNGVLEFEGRNEIGLTLTKTIYHLNNQKIVFENDAIVFDHLKILDSLNNEAILNGKVSFNKLDNLSINLNFSTEKFELVNTRSRSEDLFYGRLLAKVNLDIKGSEDDIKVDFTVGTLKGTNFTFSIVNTPTETESPYYIRFQPIESAWGTDSSTRDTVHQFNVKNDRRYFSKMDVSGRIKIIKEAELSMIVDPVNGDKVSVKGDGELQVNLNSFGNISMEGNFIIDTGSYGFSFEKLVKRDFDIERGSSITWSGAPDNGTLDITGVYHTKAARYALIEGQTEFMTQDQLDASRRRLPVDVYLYFKGPFMKPEISFDIKIPEGGDPMNGNLVVQEINQIKNNPGELNKQVFSLIIANRFTGSGSLVGFSQTDIAFNKVNQSVSKMLTNQLNSFGSEFLGGVSLNVNFEPLDQSYGRFAQNAQVALTKDISDRISVNAGGNININSNYSSGQFAGDYSVHYKINKSGSLNVKFFRTSSQNIYSSNIYTNQGFSFNFQRNFSKWKYLFGNSNDN